MMKKFCYLIFHRLLGWKWKVSAPFYDRCVICVVPHTSNWDLLYGWLFYKVMGLKANFMMKKEWFFFPLNLLFRAIGAIPIDRSRRKSTVDQMVERFERKAYFNLAITPEGTRKANARWKTGFYYIALHAQVPIVLASVDYDNKLISWEKIFYPTGDIAKDMKEIGGYAYYKENSHPKHPERFKPYES